MKPGAINFSLFFTLVFLGIPQFCYADTEFRFDSNGNVEMNAGELGEWQEFNPKLALKALSNVLTEGDWHFIEGKDVNPSDPRYRAIHSKVQNSSARPDAKDLLSHYLQFATDFGSDIQRLKQMKSVSIPHFRFYSDGKGEMLDGKTPGWREFKPVNGADNTFPDDLKNEYRRVYPQNSEGNLCSTPNTQALNLATQVQSESKNIGIHRTCVTPTPDSKLEGGMGPEEYFELYGVVDEVTKHQFRTQFIIERRSEKLHKIFHSLQITTPRDQLIKYAKQYGVLVNRPPGKDHLIIGCGNIPHFTESVGPVYYIDNFGPGDKEYRKKHEHIDADTIDPDFARNPTIAGHFGAQDFVEIFGNHKYKTITAEGIELFSAKNRSSRAADLKQILFLLADDGTMIDSKGIRYSKEQLRKQFGPEASN